MNPLKIVVLGLGNHGHDWAAKVVPACSDIAQLAGVVDKRPALFADMPEGTSCFTDLSEALEQCQPDLVVNVTPPSAHLATTLEIMNRKIPVICEKPIAESPEHAKQLLDYAKESKIFLMIAENYRYASIFRKAKELLTSGSLGRIHRLECYFRRSFPDYSMFYHGNLHHPLLMDVTVHHLDLARYLTGEEPLITDTKESPSPYTWYQHRPASAAIYTEMTNDVIFQYSGTVASPVSITDWNGKWSIECDNGVLVIDNGQLSLINNDGTKEISYDEPYSDSRIPLLREAIAALNANRPGETNIEENYKTNSWMHACMESAETKRPVSLIHDKNHLPKHL